LLAAIARDTRPGESSGTIIITMSASAAACATGKPRSRLFGFHRRLSLRVDRYLLSPNSRRLLIAPKAWVPYPTTAFSFRAKPSGPHLVVIDIHRFDSLKWISKQV